MDLKQWMANHSSVSGWFLLQDATRRKRCVRGIVRRRNSDSYANLMLPTMLRIKWRQEEKLKNALLYGIGTPNPKNEFWGEGEVDILQQQEKEARP